MRRALWLLPLLGLSACGPGSPFCSKAKVGEAPAPALALTDEAANVEVTLGLVTKCPSGLAKAGSVAAQVKDGAGADVPAEATAPTTDELTGYTTRVAFFPKTSGRYALSARFEPSLGVAERQALVLRTRAGVTAVAVPGLDACGEVDVTGTGALLCLTSAQHLLVFRGATQAQDEAATLGFTAAGPDVWTWTANSVTRWRDDGAGPLTMVGTMLLGTAFTDAGAVVTAQGLLLANKSRLARVTDSGGLTLTLDTPLTLSLLDSTGRARLVLGEGDTLALALGTGVCRVPVQQNPDASCFDQGGPLLAEDADGFWFSGTNGPVFVHLVGSPATPHTVALGELPAELTAVTAPGAPVWLLDGRPVSPLTDGETFDAFTAAPQVDAVLRATSRVLVVQVGGATQWLKR